MKKILLISVLLMLFAGSIFAEGIELGNFPIGKWLDDTYSAVWEFSSDNIRIVDVNDNLYYDFRGKTITGFNASASMEGLVISFYCEDTGKTYKFLKPPTNLDIEMTINTDWGVEYKKTLVMMN